MKGIKINYADYYAYPDGICSIEELAAYLNANYNSFVKLKEYRTDNCCPPYFLEDQWEWKYLNVAQIRCFMEAPMHLLSKKEYDRRLAQVVAETCIHCVRYEEDVTGDNLEGHRTMISLDGVCDGFERKG